MTTISLQNYLNQIDELIEESKLDEAIAHCRHILMFYPRNIAVYKLMGKAHLELRNHDDAIDLFQRVLSADPNDLVSHIALSMIYKERGEAELSLWHLERAFEIEPYNEAIREELRLLYIRFNDEVPQRLPLTPGAVARLYIKGELYQQAVQTLEPVVADVQDRLDLEVLLAEALWQGRDDQRIDAEKVCLNVLERLPNSVVANSILASIWLRTGRIGESQKYLARVQDLACLDHKSLNSETPVGRAFLTDGALALPQEITLQWLEDMPVPKQVQLSSADWMSEMDMAVTGETTEAEGEVVEEGESGMHSYDWMMDVEDDALSDEAAGPVMTDWFSDEAVQQVDSQMPAAEAEEVPDWLGDLSDEPPSDGVDYSFLDSETGMADRDGSVGTNWFTDEAIDAANDTMVDSDVPDWLAGLDDEGSETAVSDKSPTVDEEPVELESGQDVLSQMPDWLATETDELTPLDAGADEDSPDWLGDSLDEELEPIQMNAYEADNWLEDEPDEAGADMMKETEPDGSEDDFDFLNISSEDDGDEDWLSELDDKTAEDEAKQASFDADDDADEDWLAQLDSDDADSEVEMVVEEDNSSANLVSDWLADSSEAMDEEASVETAVSDPGFTDWLNDVEEIAETPEQQEEAVESVTSWLSDLDDDDGLEDLSAADASIIPSEPDDDWLNETTILQTETEDTAAESMTSWLADLEEDGAEDQESDVSITSAEEELDDDWLQDTNLLEDVGGLAAATAAVGVSDWLSDEEDEETKADSSASPEAEEDLFAQLEAESDDNAEIGDLQLEDEADEPAESDWLSSLPESSDRSAVAGELGSDWLTSDGDDALFAAPSDDDLEIPDLDSGLLSLDDDLVESTESAASSALADEPVDDADDWLSVLTQDEFDTSELEEMTPEIVSEYESIQEEEIMEEEDWSSLMYGTDSLTGETLEETNELVESDFPTSLSEEEIANSQYDDIPDWLTSEASIEDEPAEPVEEPIHPGDMLDEDDFIPVADTSSDWEADDALDWISDLSDSEGDVQSDEEQLSPDLEEFDALVDKPGAAPLSTAELLGLDDNELPDWMAEENVSSAAANAPESEDEDELLGLTDIFAEDDLDLALGEDLTEDKVESADVDEEVGLTDLFAWDEDESVDDLLGELDVDSETAVSEDISSDEVEGESLSGLLGWTSDETDETDEGTVPATEEDDILRQLEGIGELDVDASIEDSEEISATELFADTDMFNEEPVEEDFSVDEFVLSEDDDEALEIDGTGLTDLLAGTSLAQNGVFDPEESPVSDKTTAEFESTLPDLIAPEETNWLEQLDDTDLFESRPELDENASLGWLAQTGNLPIADEPDHPVEDDLDDLLDFDDEESGAPLEEAIFDIGEDAHPEDINDAISWLEDLATQQETPIEELPSVAQNAFEDDMAAFSEEEPAEEDMDWLLDAEPIAETTPPIEEVVSEDPIDSVAPPDDLDGAMAWLGEITEQQADEDDAERDETQFVADDDLVPQTDTLPDVEAELEDAMSWLDEIAAEPEESIEDVDVDSVSEETVLDEAERLDGVEEELDQAEAIEDPELVEALDQLEQQVISEGISVVMASENAPTLSDSELDSALIWLEAQVVAEETAVIDSAEVTEPAFVEEEIDTSLPDADMLTGPLDDADLNLFDRPDDPTEALAWLESMVESDGELDVELDPPPIKPSEDAVYIDESLYGSVEETEETSEPEFVVEDVIAEIEEELVVEEIEAIVEPEFPVEDEPELDLGLDLDEEDPEALFAALLAGDMEIETDLPPIKPSEDAMYVDESLYESSSKTADVVEEIEETSEPELVVEEIEAEVPVEEEPELDLGLDLDEEDPEALFAALLAGDMEIETDLPPIKPSEDAMYVDESLYESSSKAADVVEEIEETSEPELVVEEVEAEIEAEAPVEEEPELDLGLDLDEEDPEALFAALLAGDMEIETDLPPIKPSEDAMYVDESLYESSSKAVAVEEESIVEEVEEGIEAETPVEDEPALDLGLDLDEEDPEALFAALLAGDMEIETELPPIKPSEDAVYVDESLYASSQQAEITADEEISEEIDNLLDVPDDPDEAVAWLEAMAEDDVAFDVESDLPPIKPSEDAVYVDESLYDSTEDTAVEGGIVDKVPDDPDEAVAWLDKMADQQAEDLEDAPTDDDAMLPSWMMGDAADLDDNFDDILLDEEPELPEIDEHATPAEILDESLGSPLDEDVHESLPSWLEVDQDNVPVGGETGWLRTLPDLDVDSWLAAEEEATVRGFDEPTPLPVTSELSPTPSLTSELGIIADEPEETFFDQPEEEEFLVIEPDSSVSMYSIDEDELKAAQDALAAENYQEASAKYNQLVSKGGGIMILIAELEAVSEQNPDHPEFRRLLGDAYMRNGQLQKALDTYKDALNKL